MQVVWCCCMQVATKHHSWTPKKEELFVCTCALLMACHHTWVFRETRKPQTLTSLPVEVQHLTTMLITKPRKLVPKKAYLRAEKGIRVQRLIIETSWPIRVMLRLEKTNCISTYLHGLFRCRQHPGVHKKRRSLSEQWHACFDARPAFKLIWLASAWLSPRGFKSWSGPDSTRGHLFVHLRLLEMGHELIHIWTNQWWEE